MSNKINDLIIKTIIDYPFYSMVVSGIPRIESKRVAKFGIYLQSVPKLYYNEDYLDKVGLKEAQGALIHEILHVLFFHTIRAKGKNIEIWNMASDMVINDRLDGSLLPSSVVTVGKINAIFNMNLKHGLSAEEYYSALMNNEEVKKRSRAQGSKIIIFPEGDMNNGKYMEIDKMETFEDEYSSNIIENENITKGILKKIISDAKKSAGEMPSNIVKDIEELYADPKIKWQIVMRRFLNGRGRVKYKRTHLRESRRFENVMGKRKQIGINVLVAVDTSGSVTDEEFSRFIAELKSIQRISGANIRVVECDDSINSSVPLERYIRMNRRRGFEGTSFDPVFRYADRNGYKFVVYFTDGYGTVKEKINQTVLWVLTPEGRCPSEIGTCVNM
ncbi:MAG: VWA-like domain-containing protein [Andreesenia angusta]|nr:VWA-like domain-containing protein [Andreesenia angusta]